MKRKTSKKERKGGKGGKNPRKRSRNKTKKVRKRNINANDLNEILKNLKHEIDVKGLSIDLPDGYIDTFTIDDTKIDEVSIKVQEGIENINDYYIECFENNDYLEFMNEEKLKPFISNSLEKESESLRANKKMNISLLRKRMLNNSRFLPNDLFKDVNILKIIYLFKYHYSKAVFMRLDILEMMFLIMKKMVLNTTINTYNAQNDFDKKFNGLPLWIAKNRNEEFGWTQEIIVMGVECVESLLYYINKVSESIGWSNESKYHDELQEGIKRNLQIGGSNYPIENIFFDDDYKKYYYSLISLEDKIQQSDKQTNSRFQFTRNKNEQKKKELKELRQQPLKTRESFKKRDYTEPEEWNNPRNFANYIGEEKEEFDVMSILHKYYHINENYGLHEEEIQYILATGYITYFFKIIFLNNLMVTNKGSYFVWEMIKQIMYVYFDIEWIDDPDYIYKERNILQENEYTQGSIKGENIIKFLIDKFMDKLLEEKFIIDGKEEVLKNRTIQGSVQYIGEKQSNKTIETLNLPGDQEHQNKILLESTEQKIKEEIYNKIRSTINENDTVNNETVNTIFNDIIKLKKNFQISTVDDRNKIVRNIISKDILNDIIDEDRSKRYTYMELKKILIAIFKIYELRLSQEPLISEKKRKISFIMLRDLQNIINELSTQINSIRFTQQILEISNFKNDDKKIIIDSAFYLEFVCNFSKIIRKATYENNIVQQEKIESVTNLMVILAKQFVKGLHVTTFNLRNIMIGFGFFGLWLIVLIYSFLPFIIAVLAGALVWNNTSYLLKKNYSSDEILNPVVKGTATGVGVAVTTSIVTPVYSTIGTSLNTIGFTHWVTIIFNALSTTSWIGTIPAIGGLISFLIQWFGFDIIRIYYALFIPMLFTWGIWLNNKSVIMDSINEIKKYNCTHSEWVESLIPKKNNGGSKRRSKRRSRHL